MKKDPLARILDGLSNGLLEGLVLLCSEDGAKHNEDGRCNAIPFVPDIKLSIQKICQYHQGDPVKYKGRKYLPCSYNTES